MIFLCEFIEACISVSLLWLWRLFISRLKIFVEKKCRNVWWCQKYVVPLHSQFRNELIINEKQRGVAQLGSASGLGPGGRRFESCHPDFLSNSLEKERR